MTENLVKQWRKNLTTKVTLPSGNVAALKPVNLMDLVRQGDVPDTLSGLIVDLLDNAKPQSMSLEDLRQYGDVIDLVCKACFVDPALADVASETALGVDEVSFADKMTVFQWANAGATELRPFREAESKSV